MKPCKSILAAILLVGVFAMSTAPAANLQTQTATNSIAVSSTNTFALVGDNTGSFTNSTSTGNLTGNRFIDCSKTSSHVEFAVGGFFTNSTATASNITFRIAQNVDTVGWTNSAQVILVPIPGNTTNWVNYQFQITSPYPAYGLRTIENTNAAAVTARAGTCYLKAVTRDGL